MRASAFASSAQEQLLAAGFTRIPS